MFPVNTPSFAPRRRGDTSSSLAPLCPVTQSPPTDQSPPPATPTLSTTPAPPATPAPPITPAPPATTAPPATPAFDCLVCQDSFPSSTEGEFLPCAHFLCTECYDYGFNPSNPRRRFKSCPQCKIPIRDYQDVVLIRGESSVRRSNREPIPTDRFINSQHAAWEPPRRRRRVRVEVTYEEDENGVFICI